MRYGFTPAMLAIALTGCGGGDGRNEPAGNVAERTPAPPIAPAPPPAPDALPPVEPIPPGEPGRLPEDRTPVSEAPFAPTSAQGAANVVQTYFALLETGKTAEARRLWGDGGQADAFVRGLDDLDRIHARIGAPGAIEGAAGSSFVEVPVQVYGRSKSTSRPFHRLAIVVLRRVNDVPGSTEEQRKWRISEVRTPSPAAPAGGG